METTAAGINFESISAMNLGECQALLASILSGNIKAKDGLLVGVEKAQGGPRGPTAKVAPRLEACQAAFLELCNRPEGVTAKELLTAGNGTFLYTDILLVARNLTESGTIKESRHGRKATWNSITVE